MLAPQNSTSQHDVQPGGSGGIDSQIFPSIRNIGLVAQEEVAQQNESSNGCTLSLLHRLRSGLSL
jgi:hypothetical protein